ncbi:hypothetical protein LINGRAHAP2_LOCUS5281, partial [Linum grandiflorum]
SYAPNSGLLPKLFRNCSNSFFVFQVRLPIVPLILKYIKNVQNNVIWSKGPEGNKTHGIHIIYTQKEQNRQSKCCLRYGTMHQ